MCLLGDYFDPPPCDVRLTKAPRGTRCVFPRTFLVATVFSSTVLPRFRSYFRRNPRSTWTRLNHIFQPLRSQSTPFASMENKSACKCQQNADVSVGAFFSTVNIVNISRHQSELESAARPVCASCTPFLLCSPEVGPLKSTTSSGNDPAYIPRYTALRFR